MSREISFETLTCLEQIISELSKYQYGLELMTDHDITDPDNRKHLSLWFDLLCDLVDLGSQQINDLRNCFRAIDAGREFGP